ncbi:ribosomal maturation YjgA family protein [Flavobacterium wongokense]|uniref:ribosomal maturation YjgA family protein n=1 Tax=Flavobacterium wongokense TaxID=2910674 RepID=UPI001F2AC77E|nr:DUF2809 domain-containing protein [Flavobacterium sp. WG47]MCF6131991.1 DUF2809 domain-containing protein [Flavobacterium sp. WG47]
MLRFNKTYFALTVLLFITEVLIALYVHDSFVRPYMGDVLVVILIYCFIKSFLNARVLPTAVFVLLFAFAIETLQYINIVEKLKLKSSDVARTAIGTSFEWMDILCYLVGVLIVLIIEKARQKNS